MDQAFLNYDTDEGVYVFPKDGSFIALLFLKKRDGAPGLNCFTTVRRATVEKMEYYETLIGEWFNVVITKGG